MGQTPKPITVINGHRNQREKKVRATTEKALAGDADKVKAPSFLTLAQRRIFKYIIGELKAAEILGSLDVYVLTQSSIAIDRIQKIDQKINEDTDLITSKTLHNIRSKYMADFFRLCGELALSPTARAKIGTLTANTNKKKTDPLMRILGTK